MILLSGNAHLVHGAPIFGTVNSASIEGGYNQVSIKSNGSNVYVGYTGLNSVGNMTIAASTDNGTTFNVNTFFACSTCANFERDPQIAVSGQYLYAAWIDGDQNIAFARSDDNGASFNGVPPKELTLAGGQQSGPNIAVYGSNVYLEWIDNTGKVVLEASHDNGNSWDGIIALSPNSTSVFNPVIATSGSNVYTAWVDNSVDATGDINSTVISYNGTQVGPKINLSNTLGQASSEPQIAAFKSEVYVIWQETSASNTDVFFSSSTNNATSFSSKINLSNSGGNAQHPQIVTSGGNIYVVWDDSITSTGLSDILFKTSQDNGNTFSSAINISANDGPSANPKMAVSGSNVYVVWNDLTLDPNGDVLFQTSSDGGKTFGGLKKLNSYSGSINIDSEQISASSNNISTVWSDIQYANYVSATYSQIDVKFDLPQYSINGSAIITVTDPSANANSTTPQTISVGVISKTDSIGLASVALTETGDNTGIFTGSVTFTSSGSSNGTTLLANPGDVITASYKGQSSIASLFPINVAFDKHTYDRGEIAHITVNDPFEHAPGEVTPQTIIVHATSIANPAGVDLQLNETAIDSYQFVGANLVFMDQNNLFPSSGKLTINQIYDSANVDHTKIENITETITSTSDPVGITMKLNETGVNTGIFSGVLTLGSSSINHVTIKVAPGDILSVIGPAGTPTPVTNALITPNPHLSTAALLVKPASIMDTVTSSYHGITTSASLPQTINNTGGGSNGGPVPPGLVLDVIASISSLGGSTTSVPPTFTLQSLALIPGYLPENIRQEILQHDPSKPLAPQTDTSFDYPVTIDGGGYLLDAYSNKIQTVTEKTGAPVDLKLNIPATNLQHLALYTNVRGMSPEIENSDTYIIYDKGQKLQIVDPRHLFDNVKFDLTTEGVKNKIDYTITFANPMDKSSIIFRAWNDRGASSDVKINDAWQVVDSSKLASSSELSPTVEQQIPIPQPSQANTLIQPSGSQVPAWIKNNAKLWNSGSIGDLEYETGIQYLISQKIINIPKQSLDQSVSDTIPNWVKQNAGFWADGQISDDEFLKGTEYLVQIGLIKVS